MKIQLKMVSGKYYDSFCRELNSTKDDIVRFEQRDLPDAIQALERVLEQ